MKNLLSMEVRNDLSGVLLFLLLGIRWDSDLDLLEHFLYFDQELMQLMQNPDLNIDSSCLLSLEEFELARLMKDILALFREFTKKVQYKSQPTLCFVPQWVCS